jgi:hypothetical protein
MKRSALWCVAAGVVALFACSNGNGANGSFPYSGPSCPPTAQQELSACFGCYEQNCGASCITSACSALFSCICSCNLNDESCYQGCIAQGETPACEQCAQSVNNASCQQACGSQCGSTSIGGSSGTGDSGGGGTLCNTSNNACPITFCENQTNGACSSAYYEVGGQTFQCASCNDLTSCAQAANDACLDGGGPVVETGPPDVGPITDVGPVPDSPVFDASGATCTPHPCGDGGSMEYCEIDDDAGTCTQAWFQVGGQVFDCSSCTSSGCQAAEQAASMACP